MSGTPDNPVAAFIGLGAIGAPIASHVARATRLSVWNRTRQRAADFAAANGARDADSPGAAAAGAGFLLTCLPTSAQVDEVLFGPHGAAAYLESGSMVIDCTSGDPTTSRKIGARLARQGVGFIDAPVSGGVSGAESGKLTVMVGGAADQLERARPILQLFSAKIVHCGDVGAGDAVKAVNNALLAVHVWSTAEGLAMLAKLGVDPAVALDVINSSSGRSNTSMNLFPDRVLSRSFPRTFRLALLDKDVGIATGIAHETGTPIPLLDETSRLFSEARRELGEEADHVEAVKVVERRAGTTIGGRIQ